jgi:hypothetical protein
MKFCEACGAERRAEVVGTAKPSRSAWDCDRCPTHGNGCIYDAHDGLNLCPSCHFAHRIRPFKSEADDWCDAPECEGTEKHRVRAHMRQVRELVARLEARMDAVKL